MESLLLAIPFPILFFILLPVPSLALLLIAFISPTNSNVKKSIISATSRIVMIWSLIFLTLLGWFVCNVMMMKPGEGPDHVGLAIVIVGGAILVAWVAPLMILTIFFTVLVAFWGRKQSKQSKPEPTVLISPMEMES